MKSFAIKILEAMLMLGALVASPKAQADIWRNYCLFDIYGDSRKVCADSLSEALAYYEPGLGGHPVDWEPTGETSATTEPGSIVVYYREKYFDPTFQVAMYSYDGIPIDTRNFWPEGCGFYGCSDEQVLLEHIRAQVKITDPGADVELSGEYGTQFIHSDGTALTYSPKSITLTRSNGEKITGHFFINRLHKCVAPSNGRVGGLKSGWNIGHAPAGHETDELPLSRLCGGSKVWLWASVQQRQSCAANANPCYPVTGDKARFEMDFEFAGRAFVRSYHSTQQVGVAGMAAGWSVTYAERTDGYSAIDDRGYIETYVAGSDGNYYSKLRRNSLIAPTQSGYTSIGPDGVRRDFGLNGMLRRVYDPSHPENEVRVIQDKWGRIASLRDVEGREALFAYTEESSQGLLEFVFLPDGSRVHYSYGANRDLVRVEFPDGTARDYLYSEPGLAANASEHFLTGIIDESGERYATFGYDERGRVSSSKLYAAGRATESTTIVYEGKTATVTTDGKGVRTYNLFPFEYAQPELIRTEEGDYQYAYSSGGRLESEINPRGVRATFAYIGSYLAEYREATGTPAERALSYQYDANHNVTRMTVLQRVSGIDHEMVILDRTYNSRSQVLTETRRDVTSGGTSTIARVYCEQADVDSGNCPLAGLLTSVDGPRTDVGDVTTYTYYSQDDASCASAPTTCPHRKGDLWKVTSALGQVTEMLAYDGAGRVLSIKEPNGVVTDMTYSPRGWLIASKVRGVDDSTEIDDAVTRIDYWPTGLVRQVTQPDGAYTTYAYDTAHRLTDIGDNAGNSVHYTLDNAGNRTAEDTRDPAGTLTRTLSRLYNQLGQLQSQSDATGHATAFTYDAAGNSDLVTDAASHVIDNDYDPLDRLSRTLQDVGGIAASTGFQYDALDHLTAVTDPNGLVTHYDYDGLGNLTRLASPDTGTTAYTYDEAGNRISQTDARGTTVTYRYDAQNRLTGTSYPTASLNVTMTYDVANTACPASQRFSVGRLSKLRVGDGTTTQYCHDRFGNVVRKIETIHGKRFIVRYAYNRAGRLIALTYPDGSVARYRRNAAGEVARIDVTPPGASQQTLLYGVRYHPFGPPKQWIYGNGRKLRRTLDLDYRPSAIADASPGGLSVGYTFDAVGNVDQLHDASQAGPPQATFGYDALNRLTDFRDGSTGVEIEHYDYDATGNRTAFRNSGGTVPYAYVAGTHHLLRTGGIGRRYDAVGNTTSIGGTARQFVYTAAGRMGVVKRDGVVAMYYRYNGRGERVRRMRSATDPNEVFTVYDEAGHWLGDYDASGAPRQQAIWLDDLPVGVLDGAGTAQRLFYVEADALGTPRVVIDPVRDVAAWNWSLKGEAFGNQPPNEDVDLDGSMFVFNLRFPGQQYDGASGLNYNYFRDYEAGTGRYAESDPIGLNGGASTYSYVGGSALGRIDPFGLDWIEYTGRQISLYAGKYGDRSVIKRQCRASSGQNVPGYFDYRNSAYQNVPGYGPTPEGRYSVNLVPDPSRMANASGGYLTPSPAGGIERIPAGGEQSWGTWRARLNPAPGTNTFGRDNMYLHDSSKGETHGCIETCGAMLNNLIQLRSAGVRSIDVLVDYPGYIPTGH